MAHAWAAVFEVAQKHSTRMSAKTKELNRSEEMDVEACNRMEYLLGALIGGRLLVDDSAMSCQPVLLSSAAFHNGQQTRGHGNNAEATRAVWQLPGPRVIGGCG